MGRSFDRFILPLTKTTTKKVVAEYFIHKTFFSWQLLKKGAMSLHVKRKILVLNVFLFSLKLIAISCSFISQKVYYVYYYVKLSTQVDLG